MKTCVMAQRRVTAQGADRRISFCHSLFGNADTRRRVFPWVFRAAPPRRNITPKTTPDKPRGTLQPSQDQPESKVMDKVFVSAAEAVSGIVTGSSLAVGGFGLCGVPSVLIAELHHSVVADLEVVSNNCGVDG